MRAREGAQELTVQEGHNRAFTDWPYWWCYLLGPQSTHDTKGQNGKSRPRHLRESREQLLPHVSRKHQGSRDEEVWALLKILWEELQLPCSHSANWQWWRVKKNGFTLLVSQRGEISERSAQPIIEKNSRAHAEKSTNEAEFIRSIGHTIWEPEASHL